MLPKLRAENILDNREFTDIQNKAHHSDKIELLYTIFYEHRRGIDFLKYCQLLQKQGVSAAQEFGKKMEMELRQHRS